MLKVRLKQIENFRPVENINLLITLIRYTIFFGLATSFIASSHVALAQPNDPNDDGIDELQDCSKKKHSPWCNTFYFGVQFLPDYAEGDDGGFEGVSKTAFFGQFNFDAVKQPIYKPKDNLENFDHFGINISLFNSGSVESTDDSSIDISQLNSFNQISNTVALEGYYTANFVTNKITETIGSRYGFKSIVGGITQENSTVNEDTLTNYVSFGFNYQFYNNLPTIGKNSVVNVLPAGEFYLGIAHFENWAGKDLDFFQDSRFIFRGTYHFAGQFFMGLYANGGPGPDDISIFFGAKRSTAELLQFFGMLGK